MKILLITLFSLFFISCSTPQMAPTPQRTSTRKPPSSTSTTTTATSPTIQLLNNLRASMKANQWNESIDLSDKLLNQTLTDAQLNETYQLRIRAQELSGDYLSASYSAIAAMKYPPLEKTFRLKAIELIEMRLSANDLDRVANDSSFGELRANAYFKIAESYLDHHDQENARSAFARVVGYDPKSDIGRRAQSLLDQLEAVRRVEPRTVGVVLPITGKHAAISQKVLRGVQMGLGLYGNNVSSFKLAVVDSEANPDNARRGIERLVREDNVIAVIGSVLSKNANAVAAKTSELGVPSIALSQKSGITDISPQVFRNALTSEMQVRYLVKTAMEDLGIKKFAIIFPNDQYGIEFTNIFWDEVLARSGSVTAAQSYSPKETDFRNTIQRLVGTYYVDARGEEYKLRLKEWTDSQPKKTARTNPPDDLLPPVVDFEAVFIPDSAKVLGQVSAMLAYNGVKGVRLLGTNLWNVPGLSKRVAGATSSLLFVDSFVPTDLGFTQSQFVRDYKALFNEEPGIFEIQGYDSGLLLRQLISQGYTSRESLSKALAQIKDFPGALGKLSISPDREIYRPVVALTLDGTQVVPFVKATTP